MSRLPFTLVHFVEKANSAFISAIDLKNYLWMTKLGIHVKQRRILTIITNAVINNKNELWKTVRLLSKFSKTQCNLFQSSSCLSTVSICATFCIFEYLVCFSYHLLMLWAVFVCFTQFGGRLSQCQNFDKFRNTAPLFKLNLGNKKTLMQEFVSSNLSLSIDSLVLLVISPETRVMSLEIFSQVAEILSFSVTS